MVVGNKYRITILLLLLIVFGCTQYKTKTIHVNYGKILKISDTILESYSYSRDQDRIDGFDTYDGYTTPIVRSRVKYEDCRYYYANDTLVLDFGKSNIFNKFFKLKIYNDTAIVDIRTPSFWDKNYRESENIDSIYIKLDTLKKEKKNMINIKLYTKIHFPVYFVRAKGAKATAHRIFDDTCILRKKNN